MSKPKTRMRSKKLVPRQGTWPDPAGRRGEPDAARNGLSGDQQKAIQSLIDLLKGNNLCELEVERGGWRIRLRRDVSGQQVLQAVRETTPPVSESPAELVAAQPVAETGGMVTVRSPIVGTFYRSPSPDADPYVEEGDQVKKGQVLCIVEAMKLMNEIESEVDGRIVKILAESTKPVEYGQPLFLIDPTQAA